MVYIAIIEHIEAYAFKSMKKATAFASLAQEAARLSAKSAMDAELDDFNNLESEKLNFPITVKIDPRHTIERRRAGSPIVPDAVFEPEDEGALARRYRAHCPPPPMLTGPAAITAGDVRFLLEGGK